MCMLTRFLLAIQSFLSVFSYLLLLSPHRSS
jgi:hypothetical protein